jgi:hypothetical protein
MMPADTTWQPCGSCRWVCGVNVSSSCIKHVGAPSSDADPCQGFLDFSYLRPLIIGSHAPCRRSTSPPSICSELGLTSSSTSSRLPFNANAMSSASSLASPRRSTSSHYSSDDDDAITPAPASCVALPQAAQQPQELPRAHVTPSPASSRRSSFSGLTPPAESVGVDSDRLWKRMLSVQRVFGCYNSARMSAALSAGDKEVVCRLRRELKASPLYVT